MSEREANLAALTDTDLVREFRNALIAVYPILRRIACLEDDTQPYDDFDIVAESLWDVIVVRSLVWRDGLEDTPPSTAYGFVDSPSPEESFFLVSGPRVSGRFIEFVGDREFGTEPFNAVRVATDEGTVLVPFSDELSFTSSRGAATRIV